MVHQREPADSARQRMSGCSTTAQTGLPVGAWEWTPGDSVQSIFPAASLSSQFCLGRWSFANEGLDRTLYDGAECGLCHSAEY
jgi:hypothetical protein